MGYPRIFLSSNSGQATNRSEVISNYIEINKVQSEVLQIGPLRRRCIMKSVSMTEQLNAMQNMFLPSSMTSDAMQRNACFFWQNQDKILSAI